MSREGLLIHTEQVNETAMRIDSCNQRLFDNLNEIRRLMRSTAEEYRSPAAEELRQKFETAANSLFEEYKRALGDYAHALRGTTETYSGQDDLLKRAAAKYM